VSLDMLLGIKLLDERSSVKEYIEKCASYVIYWDGVLQRVRLYHAQNIRLCTRYFPVYFLHKVRRIYSCRKRKEEDSGQGELRKVNKYRGEEKGDKNGIIELEFEGM
jgi:hypothetical protein